MGMLALGVLGCATTGDGGRSPSADATATALLPGASPSVAPLTTVTLAGARCSAGACECRTAGRDDAETSPPPEGSKRFEIRISAAGGTASLDLSNLGVVATGATAEADTCAYIDVPSGSAHDATFLARETTRGRGVAPRLSIAEYGPKGPYWYDLVKISCDGPDGRCDRPAAEDWATAAKQRKRGRLDPCGSSVVTKLGWETSGGQAVRDGGLFLDFTARFNMEVKKFATQFAPGATECVPK